VATKGADIFDVPDAGQSGEFSLCRAGGGLYFAVVANGGDGGRLFVGPVGGQPARIDLGPLGVTGALSVRLDGHGPGGTLVAYIKRIVDTDGQDRGRRVITPVETGIAVGTQDAPVDPPAPPGATVDPSAVLQAIAAARGPLDGRDAPDNSIAGVKNTANAIYDRLGLRAGDKTMGALLTELRQAVEGGESPDAVVDRLLFRPPTRDYGLPHELEPFVNTDFQQYLCATLFAFLEFTLRLGEFPKADGTTILRG
jgi:hypothetical protein